MTTSQERLANNHNSISAGESRLYRIVRSQTYRKLYGPDATVFRSRRSIASQICRLTRHTQAFCDVFAANFGEGNRYAAECFLGGEIQKPLQRGETLICGRRTGHSQLSMCDINRKRSAFPEFAANIAIINYVGK
jgi:hypothetical protein